MKQSNVQRGRIERLANQDLTGARGLLCKLVNQDGVGEIGLPAAITDFCPYVVTDEAVEGKNAGAEPLTPEASFRLGLIGPCVPGDQLTLADPTVAGQAGKVTKLPAASGTYRLIALAEEAGVDGQFVLSRPVAQQLVTVQ
jgi:hypothetical protein